MEKIMAISDKLKTSEAKYRKLLDHAVDAVVSIDRKGIITLFN